MWDGCPYATALAQTHPPSTPSLRTFPPPLLLNVAALGATVVVGVLGATVVVDDRCRRPIAEPLPLGGAEVP